MGRGRAKAKQTKVARQLKYFSPETDYEALQRELHGPDRYSASTRPEADAAEGAEEDESADDEDEFDSARYAVDDDEDEEVDDYEAWVAKRRA